MINLADQIKQLAGGIEARNIMKICRVDSVDKQNRTVDVTPIDGGAMLLGVKLQPDINKSKGMVAIPKVGSNVVVAMFNETDGYMLSATEVDVYIIATEKESLNDILEDLITQIEQLTVTTSTGPSGVPINIAAFTAIKERLSNLFE